MNVLLEIFEYSFELDSGLNAWLNAWLNGGEIDFDFGGSVMLWTFEFDLLKTFEMKMTRTRSK